MCHMIKSPSCFLHCLVQVEAALGSSNYVENVMVHADPMNSYCVALVVPSHGALEKWAEEAGVKHSGFDELCESGEAVKEVQQSLTKVCKVDTCQVLFVCSQLHSCK